MSHRGWLRKLIEYHVSYFPRVFVTKYHKLDGFKQQKFIPHSFGGGLKSKLSAALVPSLRENLVHVSLLACGGGQQSLTFLGFPLISASVFLWHSSRLSVSSHDHFLKGHQSCWIRGRCTPIWPHLNFIDFHIKSHSELLGVRTSAYLFWGTQFKP